MVSLRLYINVAKTHSDIRFGYALLFVLGFSFNLSTSLTSSLVVGKNVVEEYKQNCGN